MQLSFCLSAPHQLSNQYPLVAEDPCAWQLQEAQEDATNTMREQLQQLSGRATALCQALRGAVNLLLDCIRATQRAASEPLGHEPESWQLEGRSSCCYAQPMLKLLQQWWTCLLVRQVWQTHIAHADVTRMTLHLDV